MSRRELLVGYVALVTHFPAAPHGTLFGDLDHVPVVKDLAQADATINNLAAGTPRGKDSALKRGIMHSCTFNIKAPN